MEVAKTANKKTIFNPFPGLRPFGLEESHLFFGREGQSEEVLKNLSRHRFVGVVGTSGSGKSSLMYCGLVPILHGGFIGGTGTSWQMIVTRPGNSPIDNLARAVVNSESLKGVANEEIALRNTITSTVLRSSSLGLIDALKQANKGKNENILIMVDQFEELFRFKRSSEDSSSTNESLAYVKLILKAVEQSELPIYVVLTMRSDFIGECAQFPELTKLLNESHYLIPQMTREDLRKAITGPVSVGGGLISPHLVQQLLNDIGDKQDQLPILQHALMRTWDYWVRHREGNEPMSIEHYDAIGRMEKALSEHANEAYDELNERSRYICEKLFKSLTEKANDNRGIRRPTKLKTIATIAKTSEHEVVEVINTFRAPGRSFISPSYEVQLTSDSVVDISHESLMRIWDRLKIWVEEESDAVEMYSRLAEASSMYQQGQTGLWRPPDLQLALNWKTKEQPTLTWAERYSPAFERSMVYLETSEKAYEAEEANKLKLQKRALRRTRFFAVILGVASIVSLGFLLYAVVQQQQAQIAQEKAEKNALEAAKQSEEAEIQRNVAEKQKALALSNEKEAMIQMEKAEKQSKIADSEKRRAQLNAQEAQKQTLLATQKSKEAEEQKALAEKSAKEALSQKTIAEKAGKKAYDLRLVSISQSMAVKSININKDKDEKALVAYQAYKFNKEYKGKDHNTDIYNGLYYALKALKSESYNSLQGHKNAVRAIVFDPTGNNLFTTGSDGRIIKWDLKQGNTKIELVNNKNINRSLSITSNGKFLACGNENSNIEIYDLTSEKLSSQILKGSGGDVFSVKFTPDDKQLVSCSSDGSILLWDIALSTSTVIAKSESVIRSISLSPDGNLIAGGTEEGKIIFWDKSKNYTSSVLETADNTILVVKFSNDGKLLASGDVTGALKVWNVNEKKIIATLIGQSARINDIVFSPDDKLLASASYDGSVYLWDTDDYNNQPVVLKDHDSWVSSMAFSPDGNTIIAGCRDNLIRMWPAKTSIMADQVCSNVKRNLDKDEWDKYVAQDIPYIKTCVQLPTGKGVQLNENNE